MRLGDVLSAGLVFVGTEWLAWGKTAFGLTNVGLVGLWLAVAWLLFRAYQQASPEETEPAPA